MKKLTIKDLFDLIPKKYKWITMDPPDQRFQSGLSFCAYDKRPYFYIVSKSFHTESIHDQSEINFEYIEINPKYVNKKFKGEKSIWFRENSH